MDVRLLDASMPEAENLLQVTGELFSVPKFNMSFRYSFCLCEAGHPQTQSRVPVGRLIACPSD